MVGSATSSELFDGAFKHFEIEAESAIFFCEIERRLCQKIGTTSAQEVLCILLDTITRTKKTDLDLIRQNNKNRTAQAEYYGIKKILLAIMG